MTGNLAEGYGRFHYEKNVQFCRISRGSAFELGDLLIACKDKLYIDQKEYEPLQGELTRLLQFLKGYIRSIGGKNQEQMRGSSLPNDD
jgi:four helix bundle protein